MAPEGLERAFAPRGKILEEEEKNDEKTEKAQRDVIGRDFVVEIEFRLEEPADRGRLLLGDVVQLLVGMEMFDFKPIDRVATERGEQNGQEADEDAPEVVEERMPEEDR